MVLRSLVCALAMVTAQFAPAPPPPPAPPLALGTTWTYRDTVIRASAAPVQGTLTIKYDGPATYRGHRYYATSVSDTVTPSLTEQDYYTWVNGQFRQAAVQTTSSGETLEIVFDKTVPVDSARRVSGTAETFVNGAAQGPIPWSATVASAGVETVTVPAGTFHRVPAWKTTFQFGVIRQVQVSDTLGLVDLRVVSRHYINGALASTTRQELVSGPVP